MISSLFLRLSRWTDRPVESLGGAAFIIALAGVISRLLGFVRDRLLASTFGAGDMLDAYYAAFRLPDLIYGFLVLGALSAAFIPVFTELITKEKREEAWRLTNSLLQTILFLLGLSAVLGIIFSKTVAGWIAPGFSQEKQVLVALLTRVMLLAPLFLASSAVIGGVLVSFRQFLAYSFAPVLYNVGIILGILWLYPVFGLVGLAWGVVLGALLHCLIQVPALFRSGYHFQFTPFSLLFRDNSFRQVVKLMIPRSLAMAVSQISLVIATVFASTLAAGSLAAFTLAVNIQSVPLGLFGIAFSLASFPVLSTLAAKGEYEQFFLTLSQTTKKILYFVLPLSFLLIIFRAEIVRVVLGTGAFNWEDTILTFTVLGWLSFSLFAQSLIPLLVRAFFALQDTRTPLLAALIGEAVHLITLPPLLSWYAAAGLAISFSLGTLVNLLLLYFLLRRRVSFWNDREILLGSFHILLVSGIAALVAQFSKGIFALTIERLDTFLEVLVKLGVGSVIGAATYLFFSWYSHLPEYDQVKTFIWRRILRRPETMALTEDHPEKGDW